MKNRRTVLVTGGAGFIGSNLVQHLMATKEYEVVTFDALTYAGNLENLALVSGDPFHHFVQADIGDARRVREVFEKFKPIWVVNLAAESHVDRSIEGPAKFVQTNVVGTQVLLEQTLAFWKSLTGTDRESFRFLHVSTDEVYGSLGNEGSFTEETRYAPNSPYAASKAASDHLVRAYHHTYGLPVITTNCSNNYGAFQFPEKLIPHMVMRALIKESLPVYGTGKNVRDWLYVGDHCSALTLVLDKGRLGETYNIGGNSERSNIEVVHSICSILDEAVPRGAPYRELISFVPDRPGHDWRYAIDASKIKSELGWVPKESFESGLKKTVLWYLSNDSWSSRVLSGAYRLTRLGLNNEL